jgi:hypothetical protein
MPVYCYETDRGKVVERFFQVGQAPRTIQVGRHVAKRSFAAERKGFPPSSCWPMTCVASGVNASDRKTLHDFLASKGVPTEVTRDGDPVYRDANHRRKALKARGLFDRKAYI